MATLTIQNESEDGGLTFAAASGGGDLMANDGNTLLMVQNAGVGAITVTITAQKTATTKPGFGEVTKADAVRSVAAGETDVLGRFPKDAFNTSAGQIAIGYSGVTSVTVAAVKIG